MSVPDLSSISFPQLVEWIQHQVLAGQPIDIEETLLRWRDVDNEGETYEREMIMVDYFDARLNTFGGNFNHEGIIEQPMRNSIESFELYLILLYVMKIGGYVKARFCEFPDPSDLDADDVYANARYHNRPTGNCFVAIDRDLIIRSRSQPGSVLQLTQVHPLKFNQVIRFLRQANRPIRLKFEIEDVGLRTLDLFLL